MSRRFVAAVLVSLPLAACEPPPPPSAATLARQFMQASQPGGEMLLVLERRQVGWTLVCGYWRDQPNAAAQPVAVVVRDGEAPIERVAPGQCEAYLPRPFPGIID